MHGWPRGTHACSGDDAIRIRCTGLGLEDTCMAVPGGTHACFGDDAKGFSSSSLGETGLRSVSGDVPRMLPELTADDASIFFDKN